MAGAALVSPTLFGLAGKKGIVGKLAKGLVGLVRTKGKIDPKKLTTIGLGLSALGEAQRQRKAQEALQQAAQAQQQWWQSTLAPMQQMTNTLMGYGFQFLMPWMMFPPQIPQNTQQQQQHGFPFLFPPSV